jgi:topoisomerase-4 subunit B
MAKTATKKKPSKQPDLFDAAPRAAKSSARKATARGKPARGASAESGYTAKHIEVLEGLEPVRRRPGMYIGGTDEKALHHLFAEVIDNSMDEALAGHADWIEVEMEANGFVSVTDNGRGIPVDPHPKFKSKSALEVIMCTLHAGGKFDSKVYETSGGLHGVGVSVANALSERMEVEVAREQQLYRMAFERGKPKGKLEKAGRAPNRRGTRIRFKPDPDIFGPKAAFEAERVFKMARSKAYLYGGVEIRWRCDKALLKGTTDVPEKATFHFADGLKDYRPQSYWISSSSAPRSGCAAARKKTSRASPRCANCVCPASSPIVRHRPRKARKFSLSRATAPAARPSRRAIAAPRPCCRCEEKSSTSRPPARTSWRRTPSLPI